MSRGGFPDTLELQDRLNTHLLQGRRSAILLNKHIRRLKSVKAYILNEKAKVKKEVTDYVNKLLESLLDFKSEMLQQLEDVVKNKFEELSMIKTGLEEDIDTLTTLCEETEKLLQFDSEISTYADIHRAETLEKAYRMLKNQGEQLELGNIMSLRFTPSLDVDQLNCKAFGILYPSVNGHGSEEPTSTNSNNALQNLICNNNASGNKPSDLKNTVENVAKNLAVQDFKVDINSNFPEEKTVYTDMNSNNIQDIPQSKRQSSPTPGIDPAELAAYISELSLAQANSNLAFWLSHLQIQNIPLPEGHQAAPSVQNIPFPENHLQIPKVCQTTSSTNVASQLVGTTLMAVQSSSSPTLDIISPLTDQDSKSVNRVIRAKTPPPPGFRAITGEKDESTQTEGHLDTMRESKNCTGCVLSEGIDEIVTPVYEQNNSSAITSNLLNKKGYATSEDQDTKAPVQEAKQTVAGCYFGSSKNDVKETKENVNKQNTVKIETCEYFDTGNKSAKSLNELEDSSDEDGDLIESPSKADGRKTEAKHDKESLDTFDKSATESSCKTVWNGLKPEFDTISKAENFHLSNSKLTLADTKNCQTEGSEKSAAGETKVVMSDETEVCHTQHMIEETKECKGGTAETETSSSVESFIKKSLKIGQQPRKPLRRPLSFPRIPCKPQNLHFSVKEELHGVSHNSKDKHHFPCIKVESEHVEKVNTEEQCNSNDPLTSDMHQKKNKSVTPVVEQENFRVSHLGTKIEQHAEINDTQIQASVDSTMSDTNNSWAQNTYSESKNNLLGQHDDIALRIETTAFVEHNLALQDQERKSKDDNKIVSDKNMNVLISEATLCKNHLQNALLPIQKTKYEKDTLAMPDIVVPKESCPFEEQGLLSVDDVGKKMNPEKLGPKRLLDERGCSPVLTKRLSRSFDSAFEIDKKDKRRNRTTLGSSVSESWDLDIEDGTNTTPSLDTSANSESAVLEKKIDTLILQTAWCKKYIRRTLSPRLKKKKDATANTPTSTNTDTLVDRSSNAATSVNDNANSSSGLDSSSSSSKASDSTIKGATMTMPIHDVAQIEVSVTESGDLENPSNLKSKTEVSKTLIAPVSEKNVLEKKENISCNAGSYPKKSVDEINKDTSILEMYKRGSKTAVLKGTHLITVGSKGKGSSKGLYFPIGVTCNSFGDILVTDTGNHMVKIYDSIGMFVKSIGQQCDPPLRRPSAIVVNDKDEMFVKDDICIRKFERTGRHIQDIGLKIFIKPYGLALTDNGILLVLETYYKKPCLVHFTQDGCFIHGYRYQPLYGANVNSKCRFMAVSGGTVIVSDLGLSQVYLTDLHGCFLQVIGRYGRGPMDLVEPSGVAADRYGNFIVGDSKNNKIKVWQCDGTFLGVLKLSDDVVVRPSGIHLTSDNKLLVTNYLHHQVKIYQLGL